MANLRELRALAKDLGIRGYSTANKARLTTLIENHEHTQQLMANARATQAAKSAAKEEPAPAPAPPASSSFEAPAPQESAPVPTADKPKPRRKAGPSAWNSFLRDYRKEHGGTLKQAMQQKDAYAKYKESWTRPEE